MPEAGKDLKEKKAGRQGAGKGRSFAQQGGWRKVSQEVQPTRSCREFPREGRDWEAVWFKARKAILARAGRPHSFGKGCGRGLLEEGGGAERASWTCCWEG